MGKGEHNTAEKILTGCLSLQIIVSIILTVILLIWNENLLLMFGASENTISYATAYMIFTRLVRFLYRLPLV